MGFALRAPWFVWRVFRVSVFFVLHPKGGRCTRRLADGRRCRSMARDARLCNEHWPKCRGFTRRGRSCWDRAKDEEALFCAEHAMYVCVVPECERLLDWVAEMGGWDAEPESDIRYRRRYEDAEANFLCGEHVQSYRKRRSERRARANEMRAEAEAKAQAARDAAIPGTVEVAAERIGAMDWQGFEHLVGALLAKQGYSNVTVTPPSADAGVDVVAHAPGGRRILAQVKHWSGSVSPAEVQKLRGSLSDGDRGLFVTSGSFTAGARREAARTDTPYLPITLIDGRRMAELLVRYEVQVEPPHEANLR